jgi:hypothetical protein
MRGGEMTSLRITAIGERREDSKNVNQGERWRGGCDGTGQKDQ